MGWALTLHPVRDEFHQAFAGLFDQVQYVFKPLAATVVGVRYDGRLRCLQKLSESPDLVKMLCRAPFFQQGAVVPIHGQQQIEFLKVTLDNGSGPQMRQVITALTRMRLAAFIGGRVRVEVVRSCRIDFDFVQKMVLGEPDEKGRRQPIPQSVGQHPFHSGQLVMPGMLAKLQRIAGIEHQDDELVVHLCRRVVKIPLLLRQRAVSQAARIEGAVAKALAQVGARQVRVIDMAQGNKVSRILAWSFLDEVTCGQWWQPTLRGDV